MCACAYKTLIRTISLRAFNNYDEHSIYLLFFYCYHIFFFNGENEIGHLCNLWSSYVYIFVLGVDTLCYISTEPLIQCKRLIKFFDLLWFSKTHHSTHHFSFHSWLRKGSKYKRDVECANYAKRNSNDKNNNLICCYGWFHKKHSKKAQSCRSRKNAILMRDRKTREQVVPQDHSLIEWSHKLLLLGRHRRKKIFDTRIIIIFFISHCHRDKKKCH